MVEWWNDGVKTWSATAKTVKLLFHMHYFCVKGDASWDIGKWKRLKLIRVYFVNNKCVYKINSIRPKSKRVLQTTTTKASYTWAHARVDITAVAMNYGTHTFDPGVCLSVWESFSLLCTLHTWTHFIFNAIYLSTLIAVITCCYCFFTVPRFFFLHLNLLLPLLLFSCFSLIFWF